MTATSIVMNLRFWILAGLVMGLAIGKVGDLGPYILIISLMTMMCLSLQGIDFKANDFLDDKKHILVAVLCCYVLAPAVTLLVGSFYDDNLWNGWVLVASVPCAISVVSSTFILRGNTKLAVLSVTLVYLLAIVITPVMTHLLLGNAIDPLQILKYVLLFILVPLLISVPLKKVKMGHNTKSVLINICFFVLVFITFGTNREFFFTEPLVILSVIAGCFVRVVIIHILTEFTFSRLGVERNVRIVYIMQCIWRNSGLAVTMALLLMPDIAGAAIPGAVSVVFEMVYFMVMIWFYENRVPPIEKEESPSNATTV